MSIKDSKSQTAVGQALEAARQKPAQEQAAGAAPQAAMQPRTTGLAGINSRLPRPMSRFGATEGVSKLIAGFQEIAKETNTNDDPWLTNLKFTNMDQTTFGLPYSCIIAHVNIDDLVAVVTMPVVGSGEDLAPKEQNINGQRVEVEQVPGDLASEEVWEFTCKAIAPAYPNKPKFIEAALIPIQRAVSSDDKHQLSGILFDVTNALVGVHQMAQEDAPRFSVSHLDPQTEQLTSKVEMGENYGEKSTGEVIRSDITVSLDVTASTGKQDWARQKYALTQVAAYVDLIYSPNPAQQVSPFGAPQQQQWQPGQLAPTVSYYPRIVITDISHQTNAVTLELQLLGLATSFLLAQNNTWAQAFLPKHGVEALDSRDIGAVGYEVDLMGDGSKAKIDTKSNQFTPQDLASLLEATVRPTAVISLDVDETGPASWVQDVFVAAAGGSANANAAILDAADALTGGKIREFWDPSQPIVSNQTTRILLGTYTNFRKETSDIRDLDYVAMLNLCGESDMQTVEDYSSTFTDLDIPEPVRLEQRSKIERRILGDSVEYTGAGQRVDFNVKFLEALASACHAAGAIVRPEGVQQVQAGTRAIGNWNRLVVENARTDLFSYNTGNQYGGWNGNSGMRSRW